jgi:hypothetical protein
MFSEVFLVRAKWKFEAGWEEKIFKHELLGFLLRLEHEILGFRLALLDLGIIKLCLNN